MRKLWGVAFGIVALLFAVATAFQVVAMLTERIFRDDPTARIYLVVAATIYAFGSAGCFITARQLFKRRAPATTFETDPPVAELVD
jgi:hypothetical protein